MPIPHASIATGAEVVIEPRSHFTPKREHRPMLVVYELKRVDSDFFAED